MKEVLLSCGRRLAVSVVIIIALAGKGLLHIQYNDPLVLDGTGTDVTSQMMMNVTLVSKQVSVVLVVKERMLFTMTLRRQSLVEGFLLIELCWSSTNLLIVCTLSQILNV